MTPEHLGLTWNPALRLDRQYFMKLTIKWSDGKFLRSLFATCVLCPSCQLQIWLSKVWASETRASSHWLRPCSTIDRKRPQFTRLKGPDWLIAGNSSQTLLGSEYAQSKCTSWDHSGYGLSQWEMTLHFNVVSHMLAKHIPRMISDQPTWNVSLDFIPLQLFVVPYGPGCAGFYSHWHRTYSYMTVWGR